MPVPQPLAVVCPEASFFLSLGQGMGRWTKLGATLPCVSRTGCVIMPPRACLPTFTGVTAQSRTPGKGAVF